MINGWPIGMIAPQNLVVNNLPGSGYNCYYCAAAGLRNLTVQQLVQSSQLMQEHGGNLPDFLQFFPPLNYFRWGSVAEVHAFLNANLRPGEAVALAYNRQNFVGHIIVVFKSWQWTLMNIDYQAVPVRLDPGVFPLGESPFNVSECWIAHPPG